MRFNLLLLLAGLAQLLSCGAFKLSPYTFQPALRLSPLPLAAGAGAGEDSSVSGVGKELPKELSADERKTLWKNISQYEKAAVEMLAGRNPDQDSGGGGDGGEGLERITASSGDVSAWGAGATAANAAATAGGTGSETTAAAAGTTTTTAPKPTDPYILLAKAAAMRFKDPFFILAGQYKTASEAEDEGEMERLMGQMKVAGLPPHLQSLAPLARTAEEKIAAQLEEGVDNNESETVTENIRVKMVSYYDFKRSDPDEGKYFFWYKVVISNEGSEPVQVVARMWEIEKCKGEKEVVRGAGILASQPIISPGDVYTYQSGCPLKVYPPKGRRVLGSMSGAYTMCRGNMGQHNFAVKVSRFNFVLPPPSTVYVDEVEE